MNGEWYSNTKSVSNSVNLAIPQRIVSCPISHNFESQQLSKQLEIPPDVEFCDGGVYPEKDILDTTVSYNDITMFRVDVEDTIPNPNSNVMKCRNIIEFIKSWSSCFVANSSLYQIYYW